MAITESTLKTDREVLPDSCIHYRATGRVYEPDEETGEDVATGCRM